MKSKYLTFFSFILSLILIITSQSVISVELMDMNNLYEDKTWLTLGDSITKAGIYPKNGIPTMNLNASGKCGPLSNFITEELYVSDVKKNNISFYE